MQSMTQKLSGALGAMDLVKINETMTNFETMFDNLDVNNDLYNDMEHLSIYVYCRSLVN